MGVSWRHGREAWKYRFSVKLVRLADGERFALLYDNRLGLPVAETTLYSLAFRRARWGSASTLAAELRAISLGLEWAESRGIDLEERIGAVSLLTPSEVLAHRDAMRVNHRNGRTVAPLVHYNRCTYFRAYVKWRAQHVIQGFRNDDPRFLASRKRLDDFVEAVTDLLPKPRSGDREAISAEAERKLLEVIHPDYPGNPFRAKHRHRNYALVLVYVELGVRLAEALVLKGQDLVLHGSEPGLIVHRRADDSADPRTDQPLTKTASRPLPLGDELRSAIEVWVTVHRTDRTRYPGAKKTPYLFVSERGLPISKRAIGHIFELLAKVPGLEGLTAHRLRHRWNERFSDLADAEKFDEAEEIAQRNFLMGWKKNSAMGGTYTVRATRRASQKSSLRLQRKSTEGRNT